MDANPRLYPMLNLLKNIEYGSKVDDVLKYGLF
jgi:hypothetical protein